MKKPAVVLSIIICSFTVNAQDFFGSADVFFKKNVNDGLVNYSAIKANSSELDFLLDQMAIFDYENKPKKVKLAFLINAYNLAVIKGIVDEYPVKSPMDINNFFDNAIYEINGNDISLNTLEKKILFPLSGDERLHFVLVCAAVGCPKLQNFAYSPDHLGEQLSQTTKKVLNDKDFIWWDSKKLFVSMIFSWYENDFKATGKSLQQYINEQLDSPTEEKLRVSYYPYDWTLNDMKNQ